MFNLTPIWKTSLYVQLDTKETNTKVKGKLRRVTYIPNPKHPKYKDLLRLKSMMSTSELESMTVEEWCYLTRALK